MRVGIFLVFLWCAPAVFGQKEILGFIKDVEGSAIVGALAIIIDEKDNMHSSDVTDSVGFFSLQTNNSLDNKHLIISSFGYKTQKLPLFDSIKQQTYILERSAFNLEAATISVTRPTIVREMDKFIIPHIYSSPLAQGKNIVDFLGFAPLLKVNLDGYLEVLGKGRATIYINGRKSEIDLQSIPAENIEKVEIIPYPGSQYPATERNGIVNIVLRKPQEDGIMVNITLRDQQKEKWNLNSPSLNLFLDIQKKKVNITTGISTSYYPFIIEESGKYNYYSDSLEVKNTQNWKFSTCSLNGFVDLDYHINKKHTLGFRANARTYYRKESNTVETDFMFVNSSFIDSSSITKSNLKMDAPNYSISTSLNYDISFNEKQKMSFDLNYNRYLSDAPYSFQHSNFKNSDTTFSIFRTQATTLLDGFTFKTHFQHKFSSDMQLNAGLECYGALVNYNYYYGNKFNDVYISDSLRTNSLLFKDITGAIYVDYKWKISGKWSLSAGLRGEYYAYKGFQKETQKITSNQFPNIFPSFSVYYVPHNSHSLGFDFTTSCFIPSYAMLNSFKTYYSPNLYQENNPDLKPVKRYDFALNYTLFSDYRLNFQYELSNNSWSDFRIPVAEGVTKIKTMNYGVRHDFWFSFSMNKSLLKNFLFISFDASLFYFIAKDFPSEIVTYNKSGFNNISGGISINTALNKKKDIRFETRFQYVPLSNGVSMKLGAMYFLSAQISKNFKNSTLSFGVSDILDRPLKIFLNGEIYAYNLERYRYGRTYWISYNIKFGNQKSKGAVGRNSDKIQNRL